MLFVKLNSSLIEINRYDYKNDKLYYKKIMELKQSFIDEAVHRNKALPLKETFYNKNK